MADQLTSNSAVHGSVASSAGPLAALIAEPTPASATGTGKPPVVLLVPGYTGSKEDFAPMLDPLARLGYLAVAIDLPGQYESPGPDVETAYTPVALGPSLASVVAGLAVDRRVLLLGHSFGGLVSRAAVLVGAPISGLILLCSGPSAFTSGNRFTALTNGAPILRTRGAQALYDGGQRAAGLDPDDPHSLAKFLRRRFLDSNPVGLLGMGGALLTETDRTADLAAALAARSIPVAVIAGESDDAWPLDSQRRMAHTLGTELVLVTGGAHSPAVEAPDGLINLLTPLLAAWAPTT